MKNLLALFILALAFLITACNNENVRVETVIDGTEELSQDSLENMIERALDNNDTHSYNEVAAYYMRAQMDNDFLPWAIQMANKYNNAEACYHVYCGITFSTSKLKDEAFRELDTRTKNFALYYLIKSNEMGYVSAPYALEEIFGKDTVLPKSSYYLNEFVKQE